MNRSHGIMKLLAASLLIGCNSRHMSTTELFNLRTKCGELGKELNKSIPVASKESQRKVNSNYLEDDNRCYVEFDSLVVEPQLTARYRTLFDGQSGELLAHTEEGSEEGKPYVFGSASSPLMKPCYDGPEDKREQCLYQRMDEYIMEKMKRSN
jgi:hypothetical protein